MTHTDIEVNAGEFPIYVENYLEPPFTVDLQISWHYQVPGEPEGIAPPHIVRSRIAKRLAQMLRGLEQSEMLRHIQFQTHGGDGSVCASTTEFNHRRVWPMIAQIILKWLEDTPEVSRRMLLRATGTPGYIVPFEALPLIARGEPASVLNGANGQVVVFGQKKGVWLRYCGDVLMARGSDDAAFVPVIRGSQYTTSAEL